MVEMVDLLLSLGAIVSAGAMYVGTRERSRAGRQRLTRELERWGLELIDASFWVSRGGTRTQRFDFEVRRAGDRLTYLGSGQFEGSAISLQWDGVDPRELTTSLA